MTVVHCRHIRLRPSGRKANDQITYCIRSRVSGLPLPVVMVVAIVRILTGTVPGLFLLQLPLLLYATKSDQLSSFLVPKPERQRPQTAKQRHRFHILEHGIGSVTIPAIGSISVGSANMKSVHSSRLFHPLLPIAAPVPTPNGRVAGLPWHELAIHLIQPLHAFIIKGLLCKVYCGVPLSC